jgi:hypothetical protein
MQIIDRKPAASGMVHPAMINAHVRENVLRELAAGMAPMDIARKYRLSLVTVGEIASAPHHLPTPPVTAPKSLRAAFRAEGVRTGAGPRLK